MATTSFAVGSVSVAIVWGTFFYPPPARQGMATPAVVSEAPRTAPVAAAPLAPASLAPASLAPAKAAPLAKQHPALALAGPSLAVSKP